MSARGFTLVELLIVLVIVAILTAVAVPAYNSQVARARRADAQTALMEDAQFMERYYADVGCYQPIGSDNSCDDDGSGNWPALPVTQVPRETGSTPFYNISFQSNGGTTYTLQAVPTGAMSGDACGTLTLTNTGTQGAAQSGCWRN